LRKDLDENIFQFRRVSAQVNAIGQRASHFKKNETSFGVHIYTVLQQIIYGLQLPVWILSENKIAQNNK